MNLILILFFIFIGSSGHSCFLKRRLLLVPTQTFPRAMLDTTVSWIQIFRCRFKGSWRLHRHHLWWWFFPTQTIIKLKDSGTSVILHKCFQLSHVFFFLISFPSGPSHPCGEAFFTLVDAVSSGGHIKTESLLGVPSVLSEDQSGIDAAVEMAKRVDTVWLGRLCYKSFLKVKPPCDVSVT